MRRLSLWTVIGALIATSACGREEQSLGAGNKGLTNSDGGTGGSSPSAVGPGTTTPPTSVGPGAQPTTTPTIGVGPTVGGCPAAEPTTDSACSVPGRLCRWTRGCGAGGVVGWCTPAKTWKVVTPECQPGCPDWPPPPSLGSQFGPPPDAMCMAGLECRYHSTPIQGGTKSTCVAESGGRTTWPIPAGWDDGWTSAPAGPSSNNCSELEKCSGSSGCGGACPDPAPKTCYCGPDGLMYCQIGAACGGGTATATTTGGGN
ncbi:MAG: hypothetical protein QOI66_4265 [Myxococcales bacterium]|jgi:hypothetical protein|nr:hypothetical protein [Myxococcales bacterium]